MSDSVQILYFASLAQMAGVDEEILAIDGDTLAQIYQRIQDKYCFDLSQDKLAVAVNHHFVSWDHPVSSGDVVAFIPPVAGG